MRWVYWRKVARIIWLHQVWIIDTPASPSARYPETEARLIGSLNWLEIIRLFYSSHVQRQETGVDWGVCTRVVASHDSVYAPSEANKHLGHKQVDYRPKGRVYTASEYMRVKVHHAWRIFTVSFLVLLLQELYTVNIFIKHLSSSCPRDWIETEFRGISDSFVPLRYLPFRVIVSDSKDPARK